MRVSVVLCYRSPLEVTDRVVLLVTVNVVDVLQPSRIGDECSGYELMHTYVALPHVPTFAASAPQQYHRALPVPSGTDELLHSPMTAHAPVSAVRIE